MVSFLNFGCLRMVKLSEDVFNLTKIKKIKCVLASNGEELKFGEGDFTLEVYDVEA